MIHLNTLIKVAIVLLCPFFSSAHGAINLVVEKNFGTVSFALKEKPKVVNKGNKIKVETISTSTLFDFGEVDRFYYLNEMSGGTDCLGDDTKVSLYPNPSSDYIIVTCSTKHESLSVTDLNGKVVTMHCMIDGFRHKLDLTNLPKGSYILNIDGESVKFIKN